ncbi:hypothetical protein DXG01_008999 [Tephrocybe rancida]|nr:hypothetical protein DXG01_008999 [Tephrocybe rancida]
MPCSEPISPLTPTCEPPLPLVVPLNLTDFTASILPSPLALEDLSKPPFKKKVYTRYHPYPQAATSLSVPPVAQASRELPTSSTATENLPSSDDQSPQSPLTSLALTPRVSPAPLETNNIVKIERPKQAGQSNLESLLQWDKVLFTSCKSRAISLLPKYLDIKKCLKDQDSEQLNLL